MRPAVLLAILLLPLATTRGVGPAPSPELVLTAIRMVETGDNHRSVGRAGERGAYQFRAATWRQHSGAPFRLAHSRHADLVARRHYAWLAANLTRRGLPADPYHIALAWNAGLSRAASGSAPPSSRNYAARVSNLTEALMQDTLAQAR